MTKKELKNIINNGWDERRAKVQNNRDRRNQSCKEWKDREKEGLNKNTKRQKHYKGGE